MPTKREIELKLMRDVETILETLVELSKAVRNLATKIEKLGGKKK